MRRLLLFRHSKAERPEQGHDDFTRALMDRGRKDAGRIGAYMASHALKPDRVLVSPATRTKVPLDCSPASTSAAWAGGYGVSMR